MRQPNVTVYGSRQCPDTTKALEYLDSKSIVYEFKDTEGTDEFDAYLAEQNGGKRVIPTIRVDNEVLVNPPADRLGERIAASAAVTD